jgi:uncharacterized protein YgiM (DUF1202 family)
MNNGAKSGQRCRVVVDYQAAYPDPLMVKMGEKLSVGEHDARWPAFVWCTNSSGKGGWVPEQFLERKGKIGFARCNYDAAELSAEAGEELTVQGEAGGWLWCTNERGQSGWIPVDNLEPI